MTDKVQKILSEIATRKLCTMDENMAFYNDKAKEDYRLLSDIEEFIKALQEESVSEELEKAASRYAKEEYNRKSPATLPDRCRGCYAPLMYAFKAGAKWKEQQMMSKAVNGVEINSRRSDGRCILSGNFSRFDTGDKVKLIIIKQE